MHGELRRHDVQALADVFAHTLHRQAAVGGGAVGVNRLVVVFDTRKALVQRLALGAAAYLRRCSLNGGVGLRLQRVSQLGRVQATQIRGFECLLDLTSRVVSNAHACIVQSQHLCGYWGIFELLFGRRIGLIHILVMDCICSSFCHGKPSTKASNWARVNVIDEISGEAASVAT